MSTNQQGVIGIVGAGFRHRRLLLCIFFGTIVLTLIFTLLQKKQYASELKVFVQNARENDAIRGSRVQTPAAPDVTDADGRVASEIELLSDSDLLEHLVVFRGTLLGGANSAPAAGSKEMALQTKQLFGRFDFEPVKKTNVFTVTYDDVSPELAQQVLREMERVYVQEHLHLGRPAGTSEFFNQEAATYDGKLQGAEQRLAEFQNQNHFVELQKEKEALDENLHTLEVTSLGEEAQLQATNSQLAILANRLRSLQDRITTTVTSSPNSQASQALVASLTEMKNRQIALNNRFHPDDRLVKELEDQIQNTENTLRDLREHQAITTSTDNNPTVMGLKQQVEALLVLHGGLEQSLRAHRAQVADYQTQLAHLQEITPENDALERQVAEMRGMSQSISDKRDAAHVEDLLDAGQIGNIAVVQQPTFSREHVKPHLSINLLLGAVTGIFLCAAVLMLLESTRSVVLSPLDLQGLSASPVLASVPEFPALSSLLSSQARLGSSTLQTTGPTGSVA